MSEEDRFKVHFHGEALEEWREAFPEMPPGDEVVLWMKRTPCSVCGKEIGDQELGGMDPEYIDEEGELVGKQFCETCMEEGH